MNYIRMAVLSFALVFFLFLFNSTLINTALASPAQEQLQNSIDKMLEVLRDPSLKGEENAKKRRESLRSIIFAKFNFAKMSQLSLAKHWKKRTDEEKKAFIKMFGQLLEETYVSKIETYTDEKVVYTKEYIKKNKAQIYTKIITDTVEIPIDYRMYKVKDGEWMVYDIVIEGVSLVRNYRSQFDQMLKQDSYEKLVENLKGKLNK